VLLVLVVGTSITFVTTAFSVLDAMLWRPLVFGEHSRYMLMGETERGAGFAPVPRARVDVYAVVERARQEGKLPLVEAIIPLEERAASLVVDGVGSEETATWLVPRTMRHLETAPILGRLPADPDGASRAAREIAIGEALWNRRFVRDSAVIGRQVIFDGEQAVIVGVMPARFQFHRVSEVWVAWPEDDLLAEPSRDVLLLVKMVEGAAWRDIATQAGPYVYAAFAARNPPDSTRVTRYTEGPFGFGLVAPQLAMLVLGTMSLVLVGAFVNLATLFLARTRARTQDYATLAALGAGRSGVLRRVVDEVVLIVAAGGLLGMLASVWVLAVIRDAMADVLPLWVDIRLDARGFAVALASLLAALLLVALPPFRLTRRLDLAALLTHKGVLGGAPKHGRGASALIATQVAVAAVLAASTFPIALSAYKLADVRSERDDEQVLEVNVSLAGAHYDSAAARADYARQVMERLATDPRVEGISRIGSPAMGQFSAGMMDSIYTDAGPDPLPWLHTRAFSNDVVSDNYLDVVGLDLVAGAGFTVALTPDQERQAVVSAEVARRLWPDESPLGRQFRRGTTGEWTRVIGIAEDDIGIYAERWGTSAEPNQRIYYSDRQVEAQGMTFHVRLRHVTPEAIHAVRSAIEQVDPAQAIGRVRTLAEQFAQPRLERQWLAIIIGSGAVTTVLLAMMGVFGLVTYYTTARLPELALRLTWGAQPRAAAWLVARRTLRSVAIGVGVAVLLLTFVQRFVERFAFETSAYDPLVLGGVALLVGLVALTSLLVPLRRLQRMSPHELLRIE